MSSDELSTFIDRHRAAWSSRDPAALASHHADDGVLVSPMFARVEGRGQILASYTALFRVFPDWQVVFHDAICEGRRIALPFTVTATHEGEFLGLEGTGKRCEFEGVQLLLLDDDLRIREERRVYDFTGLLTQLGVLKVKPAQ